MRKLISTMHDNARQRTTMHEKADLDNARQCTTMHEQADLDNAVCLTRGNTNPNLWLTRGSVSHICLSDAAPLRARADNA